MSFSELPLSALPLILLLIVAPIGAIDMLYFHLWKFSLYRQSSARGEMVTHLLRGALVAIAAFVLSSYRPAGAWFWLMGTLFLLDFVNSLVDVLLEPDSRAPLGGVPGREALIHIVASTFAGAITLSYFVAEWPQRLVETSLASSDGSLPGWLIWQGRLLAMSAALLTLFELGLFIRSLAGHAGKSEHA